MKYPSEEAAEKFQVCPEFSFFSSTRIRGLLTEGRLPEALRLLGHAYPLQGRAEDTGRSGLPVAAVRVPAWKALPAPGTYEGRLRLAKGVRPARVYIREESPARVEVCLPEAGLCAGELRLELLSRLRGETPVKEEAFRKDLCELQQADMEG